MRMRIRVTFSILAAVGIAGVFVASKSRPAEAQSAAYRAPRTADGKPNLNGIWQALNTANWDLQTHAARPALAVTPGPGGDVPAAPVLLLGAIGGVPAGFGVVEGEEIPYQPWAAARKKENFAHALTRDPEVKCFKPGVPRANYMPYPFQIVQSTNKFMMAYEYAAASRTIDIGPTGSAPFDSWMGHNVGHWEGETLVVDVTNQVPDTWFDRAGNFHSDALHVIERYTAASPDRLIYEATIDDPKVFSRPWKISMPVYRRTEKNVRLMEYKCVEFVEELMYGHLRKEPVVRHWEGNLGDRGGLVAVDITRKVSGTK
jgi:hypothetical protein